VSQASKPSSLVDALQEVSQFFKGTGKSIVLFTVREILDEELAAKLA